MDNPRHGVAKLDFTVANSVPAEYNHAGGSAALLAAADDVEQPGHLRILIIRIPDEIQSGLRRTAHGVDIAKRIGGSDLAVHERIVDHRRKEVDGLDEGQLLGQTIDTGVIVGVRADEEIGIVAAREVAQNLRDALRGQLSRSASARSVVDQTFFSAKKQHAALSQSPQNEPPRRQGRQEKKREEREKDAQNATHLCRYYFSSLLLLASLASWRFN